MYARVAPLPTNGLLLLHDVRGPAERLLQEAARQLGIASLLTSRIEECAVHAEGARPVGIIAPTKPTVNARFADLADASFRRAVFIGLIESEAERPVWQRLAWGVISLSDPPERIAKLLQDAILIADQRRNEWDLVQAYHRRRESLTQAEEELLVAVCDGKLNKQIANELGVSIRTVEQRRRRVFAKMKVASAIPLADRVATVRTLEGRFLRCDLQESRGNAAPRISPNE
ncbi:LuxR C-terminal-related transcriptional regulator [Botrimarina hoheduenensis]|uniref:Response regulator FixJ n=1 Tax=Botrimarina hoheduenensis TaxID=2528000 RepID=A0A5C5WBW2_9BACT|nr:LuxR C-terminal-related transcriptional regulator [Botrimarina hoheduenensis]TWT47585.1 response regulator FixJ [Botrimarina hoheduenensis]